MLGLHSVRLAQGKLLEAESALDSALALGYADARTLYLFSAPLSEIFHTQAAASERVARQYLGESYSGLSPVNIWLIGLWFAGRGDSDRVLAIGRVLDSIAGSSGDGSRSQNRQSIEAVAALGRTSDQEAADSLSAVRPAATLWNYYWTLDEPRAIERILLARALLRQGDHLNAHDIAAQFDHPAPISFVAYLAPSLEIRRRAAEALGRTASAREYSDRLIRLGWEDGEIPLVLDGPVLLSPPTEEVP
jgi:hypothetical protein